MPYKDPEKAKAHAKMRCAKYRANNREKINARNRERTITDPNFRRRNQLSREKYQAENRHLYLLGKRIGHLKKLYGLTLAEYGEMYVKQNGLCAICNKTNLSGKNLSVDHDHTTKKVRALLCDRCNRGLGFFQENKKLLEKAIKYLEEYE